MIDALVRKYILPIVLGFSMSTPTYAQGDLPEINLEQIASCGDAKSCYTKGKTEFDQGQYDRAEGFFRRALSLADSQKTKVKMLSNLGSTFLLAAKPEKAADYFKLYLDQDIEQIQVQENQDNIPKNTRVPTRLEINSLLVGVGLYEEGLNFFSHDKFTEAAVMYQRAQQYFEAHPELSLSTDVAVNLNLPLARAYDQGGKTNDALRHYQLFVDTAALSAETPKVQQRMQELELLLRKKEEKKVHPAVLQPEVITPPTTSPSFFQEHKWSLMTAGGAAALGLGALINHLTANAAYSDLRSRCDDNLDCGPRDADAVKGKDRLTKILAGSAAGVGLGAGVLFYLEGEF